MFNCVCAALVVLAIIVGLWAGQTDLSLSDDDAVPVPVMLSGEWLYEAAIRLLYNLDLSGRITATAAASGLKLLQEAADMGYPAAQTMLGVLYAHGLHVERSTAKAVLYFTFAAMNGDMEANVIMAHRTQRDSGLPKSCAKAAKYAKVAADAVATNYSTGGLPWFDSSTPGNETDRARKIRSRATFEIERLQAKKGNATSCLFVGLFHEYGPAGAQDLELALEYYTKALTLGDGRAYGHIGRLYLRMPESGHSSVKRNIELAKRVFAKGADTGDSGSINGLGYLHAIGAMSPDGVPDWERTFDLFNKSANEGSSQGLYNLGMLHLHGRGTKRDVDVARTLFQQARAGGSVLASYQLAKLYLLRIGKEYFSCASALYHFAEVNAKGLWSIRADHAREYYDAAKYDAALLEYLLLYEQGAVFAGANVVYIDENHPSDNRKRKDLDRTVLQLLNTVPKDLLDFMMEAALEDGLARLRPRRAAPTLFASCKQAQSTVLCVAWRRAAVAMRRKN
jgi:SEL1 protein